MQTSISLWSCLTGTAETLTAKQKRRKVSLPSMVTKRTSGQGKIALSWSNHLFKNKTVTLMSLAAILLKRENKT